MFRLCVYLCDTTTGWMMKTRILASAGVESRCCLCFYEWTSPDIVPEGGKCRANTTRYVTYFQMFWLTE